MESTNQDTRVTIFDTTLRDGEQSPGASLSSSEKIEIARPTEEACTTREFADAVLRHLE